MANGDGSVALSIAGDIQAYEAAIAKLETVTDKAAKKAADALAKRLIAGQILADRKAAAEAIKARSREAAAVKKATAKAVAAKIKAAERAATAQIKAAEKAAAKETKAAERLAVAQVRSAEKAAKAAERAAERTAATRAKAAEKSNQALVKLAKQQQRAADKTAKAQEKAADKAAKAQIKAANESADAWRVGFAAISAAVVSGAVASVAALVSMTSEISDMRNALGDLEAQTGIQTETLGGLSFALQASGKDITAVEASLRGLPKRLSDFGRGTGEAKVALEGFGFEADDADALLADMDGTVKNLVAQLQAVEDPGKRAALAAQLFGEQGAVITQSLGGRDLEDWIASVGVYGNSVGPEAVKQSQEWATNMAILGQVTTGAKADLVDFFDITGVINDVSRSIVKARVIVEAFFASAQQQAALLSDIYQAVADKDLPALASASKAAFRALNQDADAQGKVLGEAIAKAVAAFDKETEAIKAGAAAADSAAKTKVKAELDAAAAAASAGDAAKAADKAQRERTKEFLKGIKATSKALDEEAKALEKTAREEEARAAKAASATERLGSIRQAAEQRTAGALDQVVGRMRAQLATIADLEAASGDSAAAEQARQAVIATASSEVDAIEEERHAAKMARLAAERAAVLANAASIANSVRGLVDLQVKGATDVSNAQTAQIDNRKTQLEEIREQLEGDVSEEERSRLEATEATLKAAQKADRALRKSTQVNALKAFNLSKQLGLAQTAINTAAGIAKSIATLGPPVPPNFPGIAGVAAATAAGITQAAAINAQSPPQFALGGVPEAAQFAQFTRAPDQIGAVLERGESVNTPRATRNMGKTAIDQANATGDVAAPQVELINVLDGRVASRQMAGEIQRRGAAAFGLRGSGPTGQQNVFGPL